MNALYKYANIVAVGSALPKKIITNLELESFLNTTDAWVFERTGIKQRHVSDSGETSADLAAIAAGYALKNSGYTNNDIDFIVVATSTSEYVFPSTACLVQDKLKIPPCYALDVSAACSGFIYALSVANNAIRLQQAKRALVIGADTLTKVVNWEDKSTCILFGDGAGAVILEASNQPGIMDLILKADGKYKDLLTLNNIGISSKQPYVGMKGNDVFKLAVTWLSDIVIELLERNNLNITDIDWVVPHQANIRILQSMAKQLNIPVEKMIVTIDTHANTSAASIPLALDYAIKRSLFRPGQKILLEAFGGGLTCGAILLEWV